jgi:hypothetical protein
VLKVEHMRDFRVKRLRRLLGCSLSEAVGVVSHLVMFVCDHGGGDSGGSLGDRTAEDFADFIDHDGPGGADALAAALVDAGYLIRHADGSLTFDGWEHFEPKWARDARMKRERRAAERRDAEGRATAPLFSASSLPEEDRHTHTTREGDFDGTGHKASPGGGTREEPGESGPIPFPSASSACSAVNSDGTWARPIEQGPGPDDWPQTTTGPDVLAWVEVAGGPPCFDGAHSCGAVRARIARAHPIALDLDEWDRLIAEATSYLRANPEAAAHARKNPERWLREQWIGRERRARTPPPGTPGAASRARDGPGAERATRSEEREALLAKRRERRERSAKDG